ncbi:MAG: hypothetical protein HUK40_10580 [Desulfobacter sp.]|nr:hypothetical protein [Desulfobacter sp.]
MEKMVPGTPLQQKSTPPTWLIEGPFSDLTFTSAGAEADPGTETVTQNSEHSLYVVAKRLFMLMKAAFRLIQPVAMDMLSKGSVFMV